MPCTLRSHRDLSSKPGTGCRAFALRNSDPGTLCRALMSRPIGTKSLRRGGLRPPCPWGVHEVRKSLFIHSRTILEGEHVPPPNPKSAPSKGGARVVWRIGTCPSGRSLGRPLLLKSGRAGVTSMDQMRNCQSASVSRSRHAGRRAIGSCNVRIALRPPVLRKLSQSTGTISSPM